MTKGHALTVSAPKRESRCSRSRRLGAEFCNPSASSRRDDYVVRTWSQRPLPGNYDPFERSRTQLTSLPDRSERHFPNIGTLSKRARSRVFVSAGVLPSIYANFC
jgi:hypothetical protein